MANDSNFEQFIADLKTRANIKDVVSSYVQLRRSGQDWVCCCPFHNEKTPSMYVHENQRYFHCFGCGKGGDVITFVRDMESLSYMDAVKKLADQYHMEMPEITVNPEAKKEKDRLDLLRGIMLDANRYYYANLKKKDEGQLARDYLASRGFGDDIIEKYRLGVSLSQDGLQGFLRRKEYKVPDIQACGLIYGKDNTDSFANRIIVPIFDAQGNVVAFGGRIYREEDKDNPAKYKNSNTNEIFEKSNCVYGLNFIKEDRKKGIRPDELILVEGYMDVIALGAAGITNVIAGMGTALNEGQIKVIKKNTQKILVCYDGDEAGRKATSKNAPMLEAAGLEMKIISLPNGMDPDEVIKAEGAEGFKKYASEALTLIEYRLKLCREAYNLNTPDGRSRYLKAAIVALSDLQNKVDIDIYTQEVAKTGKVLLENVVSELNKYKREKIIKAREQEQAEEDKKKASYKSVDVIAEKCLKAERFIINAILNHVDFVNLDLIIEDWFVDPTCSLIIEWAKKKAKTPEGIVTGDLYSDIPGPEQINEIFNSDKEKRTYEQNKSHYQQCIITLANQYYLRRNKELIDESNKTEDPEERRRLSELGFEAGKLAKSSNIDDKFKRI